MSANKQIAWSYFEALNEGRLDDAIELLDDAGTFWDLGRRETVPMYQEKDSIRNEMAEVQLKFTLHSAVEEGDRVVLEVESRAETSSGFVYNNLYCFLISIWNERILHFRGYYDTGLAQQMIEASGLSLARPFPAAGGS